VQLIARNGAQLGLLTMVRAQLDSWIAQVVEAAQLNTRPQTSDRAPLRVPFSSGGATLFTDLHRRRIRTG
jgi:hypothetical protein